MPYVLFHLVQTVDRNGFLRWTKPEWAAGPKLLSIYSNEALAERARGAIPSTGGVLLSVHADNLSKALSDGAVEIGDDLFANELNAKRRSAFDSLIGTTTPADVLRPIDLFVRAMGADSHPDGELGCPTLMPTVAGIFEWRVWALGKAVPANHRMDLRFARQKFIPGLSRDSSHFANTSKVFDCCQLRADSARALHGDEFADKVAGYEYHHRFGVPISELGHYGQEINRGRKPAPPETVITDTFTAANGATVAGWTKQAGAWSIASNMLENDTPGVNAAVSIRHNTSLSGADHRNRAEVTFESDTGSSSAGVSVRFAAAAVTFYSLNGNASTNVGQILEYTAGSVAVALEVSFPIANQAYVMQCEADGGSISGWITNPSTFSIGITDSSLSNLQIGLNAFSLTNGNNHKFDNVRAEDISGGEVVAHLIGSCGRIR